MTRLDRALDALRKRGVSTVLVNRLAELSRQFGNEESFVDATRGTLAKAWRELRPDSPKGLSERTFRAHADLASLWRSEDGRSTELAPEPVLSHRLTLADLKKTVDFMEMFNLAEIEISRIFDLLEVVKKGGGQQQ